MKIEAGKSYMLRREGHPSENVSVAEFVSPVSGAVLLGFKYGDDPWPWAVDRDTGEVPFFDGNWAGAQLHEIDA